MPLSPMTQQGHAATIFGFWENGDGVDGNPSLFNNLIASLFHHPLW